MKHELRQLMALILVICLVTGMLWLDTGVVRAADTVSVTLHVGETATIVDESGCYTTCSDGPDTETATVTVTGTAATTSYVTSYTTTSETSAASGSTYYVGNGTYYLVLSNGTLSTTTDISEATAFTWTATSAQGGTVYRLCAASGNSTYYLNYEDSTWGVTTSTGQGKDGPANFSNYTGTLTISGGPNDGASTGYSLYTRTETAEAVTTAASTTITITGVAEGTTSVTVGDTTYNITVVAAESLTTSTSPFCSTQGAGSGYAVTKLTLSKTLTYDLDLSSTVLGSDNYTVVWSSADETIATVDEDGTVTGVAAGTTYITATVTFSDGSVATYTIPVTVRDDGVDYTATLKTYDFYVYGMTNTTAYLGILYGTTNSNVQAYDLVAVQEGGKLSTSHMNQPQVRLSTFSLHPMRDTL